MDCLEINDANNMNEHYWTADYWNYDVNCNGSIGNTIVGLNQKPIDNLIDFSSVLGRINGSSSDGIVTETAGTLGNYSTGTGLTYPIKYFYYTSLGIENHTALPSQYSYVMQGLDEPNFKELAYKIQTNKNYIGYTTVQASGTTIDDDFYKFTVTSNINAIVSISSIATTSMNATILNNLGTPIGATQNNSGATLDFTRVLAPGDYFLKISSTNPTSTNYQTPYQFIINTTLSAQEIDFANFSYYPNPVKDKLMLTNINLSKLSIYNTMGQLIDVKKLDVLQNQNEVDLSTLSNGMYLVVLENETTQKTIQIIKD